MPYVVYFSVNDRISVPLPSDVSVKTLQMRFGLAANTTRIPIPVPGFNFAAWNPEVLPAGFAVLPSPRWSSTGTYGVWSSFGDWPSPVIVTGRVPSLRTVVAT
jgi:hypothetical protein